MERQEPRSATEAFEQALGGVAAPGRYALRLFVTGMTVRSAEALANIRSICEEHLPGRYDLEVIDIYHRPDLVADDQIIAAPTLVRRLPEPLRRLIGDLSDRDRVLVGLGLRRK